jgi:hypothetical protein
MSDAVVAR